VILAAVLNSQFLQLGVWKAESLALVITFNCGLNKGFSQKGRQYRKVLNHFHGWKSKLPHLFRRDFLKEKIQGGEDYVLSCLQEISPTLVDEENSMPEI